MSRTLLHKLAGPNCEPSLIQPPGFVLSAALAALREGYGMMVALPLRVQPGRLTDHSEPVAMRAVRVTVCRALDDPGAVVAHIPNRDEWRLFCEWLALEGL